MNSENQYKNSNIIVRAPLIGLDPQMHSIAPQVREPDTIPEPDSEVENVNSQMNPEEHERLLIKYHRERFFCDTLDRHNYTCVYTYIQNGTGGSLSRFLYNR